MKHSNPKVSVLVPTYQHEQYIAESLDSILNQDYRNIEIVVCDDGSSDATPKILASYADRYGGSIRAVLGDKQRGVTANFNRGWSYCDGEFVALMSGDDVMYPGKISAQVRALRNSPASCLCYHDLNVFESETNTILYRWNQVADHRPRVQGAGSIIEHGTFIGSCSAMVRRSSCPDYGFDERIPYASDWLFLIESAIDGGRLIFLDRPYGGYRRHSGNLTNIDRGLAEQFRTLDIVDERYPQHVEATRRGRGRLFYSRAVEQMRKGNYADARVALRDARKHDWLTWKLLVRMIQTWVAGKHTRI